MDINVVKRIVPEMEELLKQRVRIMQRISLLEPIGRRTLAQELKLTERVLRKDVDFLRGQGLLYVSTAGVSLTEDGSNLLEGLEDLVAAAVGRTQMADRLSAQLSIPTVIVVEGDCDETLWVKENLGRKAALFLRSALQAGDIVAVTGGTTISAMATHMVPTGCNQAIHVVPARGGVGERVDIQANTVASLLADRLGGQSVMLHVPDRLSEETLEQLLTDPFVHQRLEEIRNANVVVHGIGEAMTMAKRRRMAPEEIDILHARHAVAEAFGYYFQADGQVAYGMTTVGLQLEDLGKMRFVMAVAGGHNKAEAVKAVASAYRIDILVTDEGVAGTLLHEV